MTLDQRSTFISVYRSKAHFESGSCPVAVIQANAVACQYQQDHCMRGQRCTCSPFCIQEQKSQSGLIGRSFCILFSLYILSDLFLCFFLSKAHNRSPEGKSSSALTDNMHNQKLKTITFFCQSRFFYPDLTHHQIHIKKYFLKVYFCIT